jgi:hypothetical protein
MRSPAAVAAALTSMGYRAEMSKDVFGNARIASGNASSQFGIDFHGCQDDGRCVLVMFVKAYGDDPRFQAAKADAWNAAQHPASVGMDGDFHPALQLAAAPDKAPDQAAFAAAIQDFLQAQADFERFLGGGQMTVAAAAPAPPSPPPAPATPAPAPAQPAAPPTPAPAPVPPPPAPPLVLDIRNPTSVAAVLKAMGYRAEMSKDVFGNARIASGNATAQFGVDFHGCQDDGQCVLVMLVRSYGDDLRFRATKAEAWNAGQHAASVGFDGAFHPALQFAVAADKTPDQAALDAAIRTFLQAQTDFDHFLGS